MPESLLPYHLAHTLTIVDRSGDVCTAYLSPDRSVELTSAIVATNHQGRVEWREHAVATRSVERERSLVRLLADDSTTSERLTEAFLHPPLYVSGTDRRMDTLYTVAYHIDEGRAEFRWPGVTWSLGFDAFEEGVRTV